MTYWRRPLTYVVVAGTVLVVWWALTATGAVKPLLLADPGQVWVALVRLSQHPSSIFGPIGVTVNETAIAFVIASVLAIPIGLFVGSSELLRRAYEPLLTTASALPLVILYPVLAATLGVGSSSKVALGLLYAFFPVAIATAQASAHIDRRLMVAAQVMGASRAQSVRAVVLPAISLPVIAGMRVALALGMVTIIAAEFISGSDGVGYYLAASSQSLDTPTLFAWVAIACALTIVVNVVFTVTTNLILKGIKR